MIAAGSGRTTTVQLYIKLHKLTFEMAQLERVKFGKRSEQLDAQQRALFDEAVDADIAAAPPARVNWHHEPESTVCSCG
jgi:transposase